MDSVSTTTSAPAEESQANPAVSPIRGERRPDLDWLRLIAFGLLLFFHAAMPFTSYGWHMNDTNKAVACDIFVLFCHEFRLQALFFVSGAALALSLRSRGGGRKTVAAGPALIDERPGSEAGASVGTGLARLVGERIFRLLLPLLFGLAVVIPPHAYYEYLVSGEGTLDFLSFWRVYLTSGLEPKGYIGWKHLWFLAYLLLLTLLIVGPLSSLDRRGWFDGERSPLRSIRPWHLIGLPILLIINEVALRPISHETMVIDDYAGLVHYGVCMLLGAMATVGAVSDVLARSRWIALGLGIPAFFGAAFAYFHFKNAGFPEPQRHWVVGTARAINTACWVVFWVGTFRAYATSAPAWLRPTNRYILPAYIVHQTVMVAIAYYVVRSGQPIAVKYAVIVAGTALLTGLIVAAVARVPVLRACFGYWTPKGTALAGARAGARTSARARAAAARS